MDESPEKCPDTPPWSGPLPREVTCPTAADKRCMSVILAGAPWDGFRVYGPFCNEEEAGDYGAKYLFGEDFWWIVPMKREV